MKTVRDDDGKRYLLLRRSEHACLVRDPATGNECYVRNDRLDAVEGGTALETAASGVDEPLRRLVCGVHDEVALGLVIELADGGPTRVRTLLERYGRCESDLNGRLAELTAAGIVERTDVDGERGYRLAGACRPAVATLRESVDAPDALEPSADD